MKLVLILGGNITSSGCSLVRLKYSSGGRESGGSNPLIPTKNAATDCNPWLRFQEKVDTSVPSVAQVIAAASLSIFCKKIDKI